MLLGWNVPSQFPAGVLEDYEFLRMSDSAYKQFLCDWLQKDMHSISKPVSKKLHFYMQPNRKSNYIFIGMWKDNALMQQIFKINEALHLSKDSETGMDSKGIKHRTTLHHHPTDPSSTPGICVA